ncbi:hypothetical protein D0809_30715, partial [Flavobacterium circumlabens]
FTIKKANLLFWIFLFLIVLLQLSLSSSPNFTLGVALIHAVAIVLILRVHVSFLNVLIKKYLKTHDTAGFVISAVSISFATAILLTAAGYFITTKLL